MLRQSFCQNAQLVNILFPNGGLEGTFGEPLTRQSLWNPQCKSLGEVEVLLATLVGS